MTFQKGNTLWEKGIAVRKERQKKIDEFFAVMQLGGKITYADLCDKLSKGIKISKEEKEFMDRYEKLWPYVKAKKTDVTTNDKELNPLLVKFIDGTEDNTNTTGV
tara:strand:+ start:2673 stop:2987 length:315 start_codon:yes stop_codon:yes gene_type:complete